MPESAKILPFRGRQGIVQPSPAQATALVQEFLATPKAQRSGEYVARVVADGDTLAIACSALWNLINTDPSLVVDVAPSFYKALSLGSAKHLLFDERDYFLGEMALLAGGSSRLLGRRDEAESWFDKADANFRHTVAPAAHLGRVSYNRLALRYDMGRFADVVELIPSTALTFAKLGMRAELAKSRFLEAVCHKVLGNLDIALGLLEALAEDKEIEQGLRGSVLMNLGDLQSERGFPDRAILAYQEAQVALLAANRLSALADLKAVFAQTLISLGRHNDAVNAYREAVTDHVNLGMVTRAAYLRLLLANALLLASRGREAEWEIQAALPTIEQQSMVPEGFAAVALLRESVRQRNTDPKALLELQEYLRASN